MRTIFHRIALTAGLAAALSLPAAAATSNWQIDPRILPRSFPSATWPSPPCAAPSAK